VWYNLSHMIRRQKKITCELCGKMVFTDIHTHRFASDDPHAGTADGWKIRECTSCHFVQVSPKPSESDVVSLYHEDWEHFSPYISQTAIHRNYFNAVLDRIEQLKREGRRQKTENGRSKSENRKHQSSVLSPQSSFLTKGSLRIYDQTLSDLLRFSWR